LHHIAGDELTDFFIASDDELNLLDHRPSATKQLPGMADSDIDLLMLCNLESILTGADWECIFDSMYINPVRDHGPDGPWIYQVSNFLLEALEQLNSESMQDCARQWAETDEWTLREGCPREEIMTALAKLIGLSRLAGSEGKHLFIATMP
jgi:hypothetical protein